MILSAKYGFLRPEDPVPGPYNVTFKVNRTGPVDIATLQQQVVDLGLHRFRTVIALGGKEYRDAVRAAFEPGESHVDCPFAGLPLGKYLRAVKDATAH
jgi:hypothetical protein